MRSRTWCWVLASISLCLCDPFVFAEEPRVDSPSAEDPAVSILALPALGVWGDIRVCSGYRIQKRIDQPDTCRLLAPNNMALTRGPSAVCETKLASLIDDRLVVPPTGEVTLLIHGILRHARSLGTVRTALAEADMHAEPFDYPSTKASLEQAADYLAVTLNNLGPDVTKVNFVVHSMGGLLVRTYLKRAGDDVDPRLHRLVMIATPNHGAELATKLRDYGAFRFLYGPAGQQLAGGDNAVALTLPTPSFDFAVIAGARGSESGWNPLLPGDDDGTITVSSTRLSGATDFRTFKSTHSLMLFRRDVADAAVHFLQTGSLHDDGHVEPIE